MNDRFKFRAKRIDNNKFVYGYLCFIYIDNEKHCKIYSPDDAMSYDCYTETLGQCTGLKDRNGRLIYDGDIVKVPNDWEKYGFSSGTIREVFFNNGGFRLKPQFNKNSRGNWLEDTEDFEICGNIHENKEQEK